VLVWEHDLLHLDSFGSSSFSAFPASQASFWHLNSFAPFLAAWLAVAPLIGMCSAFCTFFAQFAEMPRPRICQPPPLPRSDYLAMGNGAKDMNIIKCYNYIFASLIKQCLLDSKCPLRCLYRGDQAQNKAIN